MFSVKQKREISKKVQQVLRDTGHPELPKGEIDFLLRVNGAIGMSWADIRNNGAVINPHNEMMEQHCGDAGKHNKKTS